MFKLSPLFTALGLSLCLAVIPLDSAYAKPKAPEVPVIEKTLSGRTNPKAVMGNKMAKALQKAQKLSEDDKFAEATAIIDEALKATKLTPYETSKANQIKASYHWQNDNFEGALSAAKASVAANGLDNIEHLQTMFMGVQILNQMEKYKEAVAAFDVYEKEAPKLNGTELSTQAVNYYYQDDYKNAIKYIDRAFATGDAPQKQWTQVKANSFYQGEDYEGTITYMKELMAKEPANNQWLSLAVSAYLSLDKYTEAQALLADAKTKGRLDSDGMWTQLYQLYANTDKYVEAADTIDEGIKAGMLKADAKVLNSQGQYLYMAAQDLDGKPEAKTILTRAQDALTKAAAADGKDGTAELWLGQIAMFELDDSKKARDLFASAVKKTLKQPGNAWYYLAVAEDQIGNKAAAKAAIAQALKFPESKSNAERYSKNLK